jgi:hypothetical protein
LVGKPGSSKTLAATIIKNNFTLDRKKEQFKMFPAIDIISYQCSPQTTSTGTPHRPSLSLPPKLTVVQELKRVTTGPSVYQMTYAKFVLFFYSKRLVLLREALIFL